MKTVYDVLIRPIVTEATMNDIADKKYSFEVLPEASKPEIAAAVETVFGVKVAKVNVVNVKARFQVHRVLRRNHVRRGKKCL